MYCIGLIKCTVSSLIGYSVPHMYYSDRTGRHYGRQAAEYNLESIEGAEMEGAIATISHFTIMKRHSPKLIAST